MQPSASESGRRQVVSYPVRADSSASRQTLCYRLQGDVSPVDYLIQAPQGKAVDHLFAAAFRVHKTAVPQTGQVGTDPRLRLADRAHQLTDSALPLLEQLEDVQTGRISQNSKKASGGCAVSWG